MYVHTFKYIFYYDTLIIVLNVVLLDVGEPVSMSRYVWMGTETLKPRLKLLSIENVDLLIVGGYVIDNISHGALIDAVRASCESSDYSLNVRANHYLRPKM